MRQTNAALIYTHITSILEFSFKVAIRPTPVPISTKPMNVKNSDPILSDK